MGMYDATACGIKLVARSTREGETDLMIGCEHVDLELKGPTGADILRMPPSASWTFETVCAALNGPVAVACVGGDVADAYLGVRWIGGTEI